MAAEQQGVSFVVTVFNKEPFLERTLNSLLKQEGDFQREFLVVDDGSTDRSFEIALDVIGVLANGRVLRQENSGPAVALNNGVAEATLPFVKTLDGDDILAPDATARLLVGLATPHVALATAMSYPLLGADAEAVVERHGLEPTFQVITEPLAHVIRHSMAGCSTVLFRRDRFLDCGGCDPTVFVQDYTLIWRMAVRNAIATSKDQVCFSPAVGERTFEGSRDSLTLNKLQVEHDRNAALLGLLRDFPEIPVAIKRLALRRAAGRAWKWANRVNKAPWGWDLLFWINLLSYSPWVPDYSGLIRATLAPYRQSGHVRVFGEALELAGKKRSETTA